MVPFGMKKPVKVRDIMSDSSAPRILRESMPVVRAGAVPVWIPGLKSAECLRIQGGSGEILLLTYAGGPKWN